MTAVAECPVAKADSRLTEQLWISFASLLRSHVAMRSIARPAWEIRVASASGSQIEIVSSRGIMRISAAEGGANAIIESTAGDQKFFFTADGWVVFLKDAAEPSLPMELEAAVEHLLDQVCP